MNDDYQNLTDRHEAATHITAQDAALTAKDAEIARLREALQAVADDRLGDQAWAHARAALAKQETGHG